MLGIVVVIVLSWLILWFVCKEHLSVLGFKPTWSRIQAMGLGLIAMALFCAVNLVGQAFFQDVQYVQNPEYGFMDGLNGTWWTLKAALFEELIFRGAILYVLIRKIGILKACIISAIAFGIYHWFSYGMFGRGIIQMAYVFLLTGASGWMFAYAFAKSKSILLPLALHFGWIVVSIVFLSAGPLGDSMFVLDGEPGELGGWELLFFFLWQAVFVPGIICWFIARRYSSKD